MSTKSIVVVGAGGLAREVAWLIQEINRRAPTYDLKGFVISDSSRVGPRDSRDRLLGDYTWLDENRSEVDCLALAIGTPDARATVGEEMSVRFPDISWPTLVHPSVRIDAGTSELEDGAILCAGVIASVNVHIGRFSLVNPASTVGHESSIGEYCVLNWAVNVAGGVEIGDRVLVGSGAQVLQYLKVGDGAKIGAGAVCIGDVAAGATVVGVPARQIGAESDSGSS